jgi:hypothetical protein
MLCSGGKNAMEILGACPSSRRRLAQKAFVIISSMALPSGLGEFEFLNADVPAAIRASSRLATVLAAG